MPNVIPPATRAPTLSAAMVAVLVVACSGTSSNGGDDGSRSQDGIARTPTFSDEEGSGGQIGTNGGAPGGSSVCAPSPANYDIPGNGCDDDGDGRVDVAAPCDTALPVDGDAAAFVKALGLCKTASAESWGVVSAKYTRGWNTTAPPAEGQHGILGKFGKSVKPREGASLGILSTGFAREFDSGDSGASPPSLPNIPGFPSGVGGGAFQGGRSMTDGGAVPPGYPKPAAGCDIATDVHDVAALELELKVPANARGLAFDFDFYSGEWPEFVCTTFNDGFAAFLLSKASGNVLDNISFDAKHNPVSVNNGFFDRCTPNTQTGCDGGSLKTATCPGGESELDGTGFAERGAYCGDKESTGGGATGWLTSTAPVEPGETIKLLLVIWDTGDAAYDSSVLLDHLTWQPGPTETKTERPK